MKRSERSRFRQDYADTYRALGLALRPGHGVSATVVSTHERRLGILLPAALRDYYLVAGRERRFNHAFDTLISPKEWFLDAGHVVVKAENQGVVFWGIPAREEPDDDPPVFQGVNAEEIEWFQEHDRCSVFLRATLLWNAVFGGGLRECGSAVVPKKARRLLDRNWKLAGEVNEMRAYYRPGEAACLIEWDDGLRVFAGAGRRSALDGIAEELGVVWDRPFG